MTEYNFLEEFSENLKGMMRQQNMDTNDLAHKTGLSNMSINRYLNAKHMPSAKSIVNLSIVLDCEIDDLIPVYNIITD